MASSTSSHGSSKSVPSTFSNRPSTISTSWSAQGPHVAVVVAEEALGVDRVDPLAALLVGRGDLVASSGRWATGWRRAGSSGGRGMISNWWTDAAPWRCAVPRQSAPVSPPPMMTTCLPSAVIGTSSTARSPSCTRLAHGRYSIAWWMPSSSRPGIGRSRPAVAPPASTTASNSAAELVGGDVDADVRRRRGTRCPRPPSASRRRSRWRFSILNSGMP